MQCSVCSHFVIQDSIGAGWRALCNTSNNQLSLGAHSANLTQQLYLPHNYLYTYTDIKKNERKKQKPDRRHSKWRTARQVEVV